MVARGHLCSAGVVEMMVECAGVAARMVVVTETSWLRVRKCGKDPCQRGGAEDPCSLEDLGPHVWCSCDPGDGKAKVKFLERLGGTKPPVTVKQN